VPGCKAGFVFQERGWRAPRPARFADFLSLLKKDDSAVYPW
jgi:hypothetical protein